MLAALLVTALALTEPALAIDKTWLSGSGVWSNDAKWNPANTPGATDVALIGGSIVTLDENAEVAGLQLSSNGKLNTNGNQLKVLGGVAVRNSAQLTLANSPAEYDFETHNLQLAPPNLPFPLPLAPGLNLGGSKTLIAGKMTLANSHAQVIGGGEIHFTGPGVTLINAGTLRASGVTQHYKQPDTGLFDLDGESDGDADSDSQLVVEDGGTMIFEAQLLTDAINGSILIQANSKLEMNIQQGWEAARSIIASNPNSSSTPAHLSGSPLKLFGNIGAQANTALEVDTEVTFATGSSASAAAGATVDFLKDVRVESGAFNSQGAIRFHGRTEFLGASGGTVQNMPSGHMSINAGWFGQMNVENHGLFDVGENIIAESTVDEFINAPDGTLRLDLLVTASGIEHDYLSLLGDGHLGGILEIALNGSGPHLPIVGDRVEIMGIATPAHGHAAFYGMFLNSPMSFHDGLYYFWDVRYGEMGVAIVLEEISPVPEPSTIVLAVFATGAILPLLRARVKGATRAT